MFEIKEKKKREEQNKICMQRLDIPNKIIQRIILQTHLFLDAIPTSNDARLIDR